MSALGEFWFRWGAACWLVAVSALLILLSYLKIDSSNWIYQRELLAAEPWRAVSHAFVHLNSTHMLLNLLALWLTFLLFQRAFSSSAWVLVLLFCSIVSTLGLYYFSARVDWVTGLSGALHGLFVYAVLRCAAQWVWTVLIFAKLVIEQLIQLGQPDWLIDLSSRMSVFDFTSTLINADVVVDAHLWGAIGGLIIFSVIRLITWLSLMVELSTE